MATYKIFKGRQFSFPLMFGFFWKKKILRKTMMLGYDCAYSLDGGDQEDHNKLFGIGYLPNHHTDSARFGWRYETAIKKVIISAYVYVDGERLYTDICEVAIGEYYEYTITLNKLGYFFSVKAPDSDYASSLTIPKKHTKRFSYLLGFYFGGNKSAPHTVTLKTK